MVKTAASKQMAVLSYIHQQVATHGYPPTVREICKAVGLSSTSTVHGHINRLIKKGYLQKDPSKPRALEITPAGMDVLGIAPKQEKIPLLGIVAAGEPILAVEDATDYFPIPPSIPDHNDLFMLQIQGNSMVNMGILNGDKVIDIFDLVKINRIIKGLDGANAFADVDQNGKINVADMALIRTMIIK